VRKIVTYLLLSLTVISGISWFWSRPVPIQAATGLNSRGYITSPTELSAIKTKASQNQQPYQQNVADFMDRLEPADHWSYGSVSGEFNVSGSGECFSPSNFSADNFLAPEDGGTLVYDKVLAYHLTGNVAYAAAAREKILDLTDTHTFGGETYSGNNECILKLAFAIPLWIQSADLLEESEVWTSADKLQFQNWLRDHVYKKVAWASRERANNWGVFGSVSAAMIGDYLADRQGSVTLSEVSPSAVSLTPAQAYQQHNQLQLDRISGTLVGDAQCDIRGIQTYGGLPEELRRGNTGCTGQWLVSEDDAYSYTALAIEGLIFHAEFLWHRGDTRLYDHNVAGKGSLRTAILFVIQNPIDASKSRSWQDMRRGNLFLAYRYYTTGVMKTQADAGTTFKSGSTLPYGRLTHEYGPTENPAAPQVVAPPGGSVASPTPSPSPSPSVTPTPSPSPTPTPPPSDVCAADINQDGTVNIVDYTILATNFFQTQLTTPRADINQDGNVNIVDYTLLAGHFFETCLL